jgi:hypothetical protein
LKTETKKYVLLKIYFISFPIIFKNGYLII